MPIEFQKQAAVITGEVDEQEIIDKLQAYLQAEDSLPWYIGDLQVYHEMEKGDTLFNLIDGTSHRKREECREVSLRFRPEHRFAMLSWEHHRAVSRIDNFGLRMDVMRAVQAEGLTSRQAARKVNKMLREAQAQAGEKDNGQAEPIVGDRGTSMHKNINDCDKEIESVVAMADGLSSGYEVQERIIFLGFVGAAVRELASKLKQETSVEWVDEKDKAAVNG